MLGTTSPGEAMDQRRRPDGVLRTGTTAVGLFSSHHKARYWGPAVPGPAISAEGQCKLMNFTVRQTGDGEKAQSRSSQEQHLLSFKADIIQIDLRKKNHFC